MGFERFTQNKHRFKPKVSIRQNGQIGFNNGSRKKYHLDDYSHAIIYYDKDEKRIGIQLTNNSAEEGSIKIHKRSLNVALAVKSFLEFYEIRYTKTQRFDPEWHDENKMITINLKESENKG